MDYISVGENKWLKILEVVLTEEQLEILKLDYSENKEAIDEIYDYINSNNKVEPSESEIVVLLDLYNSIKPKDFNGIYSFIDMNVTIDNEEPRGLLNCRIGEEHLQIRF